MQSSYLQDKNWRIRILRTLATGQIWGFPNTVSLIYFICPSGKNTDNIRTKEARSKQSRDHILYCPVPTGLNPFGDSQESRKAKKAKKVFNLLLGPTKKRFALELFKTDRRDVWLEMWLMRPPCEDVRTFGALHVVPDGIRESGVLSASVALDETSQLIAWNVNGKSFSPLNEHKATAALTA